MTPDKWQGLRIRKERRKAVCICMKPRTLRRTSKDGKHLRYLGNIGISENLVGNFKVI